MKPISRTRHTVIVKLPKVTKGWALSNMGRVWSFHRTRRDAVKSAEELNGSKWADLIGCMEVWKAELRLSPVRRPRRNPAP